MLIVIRITPDQLKNKVRIQLKYDGTNEGKNLEKRINRILNDERLWEKIKDNVSGDNISAGFKIGRLTINGRFDLGRHTEL
jgi:ABC-type phosphate transport system ATPase subunit